MNNNYKVELKNASNTQKVLATAAFGFALISFISTALGLNDFAFGGEGEAWKGYLLSFCVQGSLLTLNLNLPSFCANLRKKKNNLAILIVVLFYTAMLYTSSFFSAVYITNLSYDKTELPDVQAIAEREVGEILDESSEALEKHLYGEQDGVMTNLRGMISEYQKVQLNLPVMSQLGFSFSQKVEPDIELDPNYESSTYIAAEKSNAIAVWNRLNDTVEELEALNVSIGELSNKNITDAENKTALIHALEKTEQLIVKIEDYQTQFDRLKTDIEEAKVEREAALQMENGGYHAREILYTIEYKELLQGCYGEFLPLIQQNSDGAKGVLLNWRDNLQAAEDRDQVAPLFVQLTMLGEEDENYDKIKLMLYDVIEFVVSYAPVSEVKTLQEFDIAYSDYENCRKLQNEMEAIQDLISNTSSAVQTSGQNSSASAAEPTDATEETRAPTEPTDTTEDETAAKSADDIASEKWAQDWNKIINELHKILLKMPEIKDFSAATHANNLTMLYRNNFSEISAVEEFTNRLLHSGYPAKAIFSIIFALLMDVSSFFIGLIIFWRKKKEDASLSRENEKSGAAA